MQTDKEGKCPDNYTKEHRYFSLLYILSLKPRERIGCLVSLAMIYYSGKLITAKFFFFFRFNIDASQICNLNFKRILFWIFFSCRLSIRYQFLAQTLIQWAYADTYILQILTTR